MLAVNPALVDPAGTVTDCGTTTALLSDARLTAKPPLPAAELSMTVHVSLAEPVIEIWPHEIELSVGLLVPEVAPPFP
jgi:hypothetical protein